MRQRAVRPAVAAAAITTAFVVALLVVRPVPFAIDRLLGVRDGLELTGGMALVYRPPPDADRAVRLLQLRIRELAPGGAVRRDGDRLVVELPGVAEDQVARMTELLAGGVQFQLVVSDAPVMRRLFARIDGAHDPRAAELGVHALVDTWKPEEGDARTDYYLAGNDRTGIETYLRETAVGDLAIEPDREIGFEQVAVAPGAVWQWRTYYLDRAVALDGSVVTSASASVEPETGRSVVLVDFDSAGRTLLGNLTARHVGDKLATLVAGAIASAPIINSPILGGRVSISMGGGPIAQERDAAALATTLRLGALPRGGEVVSSSYVAPSVSAATIWLARLVCGLALGAIAFVVILVLARGTEPSARLAGRASRPIPVIRVVVTIAAVVVLYLTARAPLPGLNLPVMEDIMNGAGRGLRIPGVFGLGLGPLITAFVLVELFALLAPGLRPLRVTSTGRRRLAGATAVVALVLAALQGYFVARYFQSLDSYQPVMRPGWTAVVMVMLSYAGATTVLALIAAQVSDHGLGNGYSVLIAGGFVLQAGPQLATLVSTGATATVGLAVVLTGGVAIAIGWLLSRRVPAGSPGLPVAPPVAGLIPLTWAPAILVMVGLLAQVRIVDLVSWRSVLTAASTTHDLIIVGVAVALTAGLGWLMSGPRPPAAALARMTGAAIAPSSRAWWRATGLSIAVVAAIGLASAAIRGHVALTGVFDVIGLATVTAIGLDLHAEWRARRRGELVAVWPIHQAAMTEVAIRVLAAAGITAHMRGRNHRMLLHVFGPFVPIEVMVAPDRAGEATALLRDVFDPAARGSTSAW